MIERKEGSREWPTQEGKVGSEDWSKIQVSKQMSF